MIFSIVGIKGWFITEGFLEPEYIKEIKNEETLWQTLIKKYIKMEGRSSLETDRHQSKFDWQHSRLDKSKYKLTMDYKRTGLALEREEMKILAWFNLIQSQSNEQKRPQTCLKSN